MPEKRTFNNNLKALRGKYRLTQEGLAEAVGYSVSIIKQIESNRKELSPSVAASISEKFGVPMNWLYGLDESFDDKAGDTVLALKHIFHLDLENAAIKIDERLYNYLLAIENVEAKKEEGIPTEAYQIWLTAEKDKYNKSMSKDEATNLVSCRMVGITPTNRHKQELVINQLVNDGVRREVAELIEREVDLSSLDIQGDIIANWDDVGKPLREKYSMLYGVVTTKGVGLATPPTLN